MNYPPDDPYNKRKLLNFYVEQTKWQLPREMLRSEREPEQTRGCGDPDCSMCNPSIAAERARTGRTGSPYEGRRDSGWTSSRPELVESAAYEAVKKFLVKAPEQAFEDIIGNEAVLEALRDAVEAPIKYKNLYEAYDMKMPKGAMLSGPPGCGKTMFARAVAYQMKQLYGLEEFICISGSELQSMFVGATEQRIKAIFTYAREYSHQRGHPLLVFIDEAEVILPDRTGRVRHVAPWEESQVATFLAEMDGIQESGAFLLLATNRPEVIDQAVLRDGRCDFKIVVERPSQEATQIILERNFADLLCKEPVENLVFAAVESLYDPHKVIMEYHEILLRITGNKDGSINTEAKHGRVKHFCLEHIISGAIAASIPRRALRHAFARDKAANKALGITTENVLAAVNEVFAENRGLEHSFALEEFRREHLKDEA